MSQQLQFEFGATSLGLCPPGRRARQVRSESDGLLFRIHPSPVELMAAAAHRTRRTHGLTGKPRRADQLHISLVGVRRDEGAERGAAAAAATVRAQAFDLTFDRMVSFRNGETKPLVLLCREGADRVIDLERRIVEALNGIGLRVPRRAGFVPHCTLLYDSKLVPEMRLDRPIVVPVTAFHLLHRSDNGRLRRSVGSWPLPG